MTEAQKRSRRDYQRRRRARQKEEGYKLYYLPNEHYVGITLHLYQRMFKHREREKDTDGYKILAVYPTLEQARHHENLMHSWMGCNGLHLHG